MKEATGELNMTLVTVLAVAAVLAFVVLFLPNVLGSIQESWGRNTAEPCTAQEIANGTCVTNQ